MARGKQSSEHGSITPLIIGFMTIIGLLVVVVIDASTAFMYQRALHSVADGAALAATNGIDTTAIYEGGIINNEVKLDLALASEKVNAYVGQVEGMPGISCAPTDVANNLVTVECQGTVKLPIVNDLSSQWGTLGVTAEATAETFANG